MYIHSFLLDVFVFLSVFVIRYVLRIFKMQDGPHRYKYGYKFDK